MATDLAEFLGAAVAVFVGVFSLCSLTELILVKPIWGGVFTNRQFPF